MSTPLLTHDETEILTFEDLLARLAEMYGPDELAMVRSAHDVAARVHAGQERRSGEPYLNHPLAVAVILSELRLDPTSIAVALLHDVLEDTDTTREQLAAEFGDEVAKLVEGVTKIGQMEFTSEIEQQAVNIRKLLLAMVDDVRVLLVKLADRLHNLRTLAHLDADARERIARETLEIYAPLAHRLGMARIQRELEDRSFQHTEPATFARFSEQLQDRLAAASELTERIEAKIQEAMAEHDLPCRVEHRVKGLHSLHCKMVARELDLDQVFDHVAFRIITASVRHCYQALGIIHNIWSPVPGRFKDFIAIPKRNMYQSLHTTLMDSGHPFEVQIRTEEMHRIAEEGIAAHWLYKEGKQYSASDAQPLHWLRQLVEFQREVSDPREFLSSLKLNLYPDEVYVFTPKGEVRSLPRSATPLDFAYLIHTEIGHHCVGAKVNGKLVPLRQRLRNGDIVEITTSADATPSRDWLRLVATSRARNKIRSYINRQERERSIELGKRILEKELRKYSVRFKRVVSDGTLEAAAEQLGLAKADDLLVALSYGKVAVRTLIGKLLPEDQLDPARPPREPSRIRRVLEKAIGWGASDAIQVKGIDDVMVYRARCCGPVPGEPIVGYVTRGKGVSVHATSCGNVNRLLLDEARRIDVVWRAPKDAVQPVRLRVDVDDRPGLLASLTSRIAQQGSNIRHIVSKMKGYRGTIDVIVEVRDRQHLRALISEVQQIDGVREVRRGRAP